jgi:hypothetical protein
MPRNPAFELLETICQELAARSATIILEDDLPPALLESLKDHFDESGIGIAFERALIELREHFAERGSALPFEFDTTTGEFRALENDYIRFIAFAANSRGLDGSDAREFEVQITERLAKRLTGSLHHVGSPRKKYNKKKEFVGFLQSLGFDKDCLEARDKDGGFDILWLPPLGRVPIRPVVSLQCKNSSFNMEEANKSFGRAHTTLQRHSHIRGHNGLYFVVFNDYIDDTYLGRARGWAFIPLGLSDLGIPRQTLEKTLL